MPLFNPGLDVYSDQAGFPSRLVGAYTSIAISRSSATAGQNLGANATYDAGYIDTWVNGIPTFGALQIYCRDYTGGTTGGILKIQFSKDGTNSVGLTETYLSDTTTSATPMDYQNIISCRERYFRIKYTNGTQAQNTTYSQCWELVVTMLPLPYGSETYITNSKVPVTGYSAFATDYVGGGGYPVIVGGIDSLSAPSGQYPWLISNAGVGAVIGSVTNITGNAIVTAERGGTTGTLTNTSVAASSTQVAASATARRGFSIHNDSSQICYLKYGTAASNTSYTVKLGGGEQWFMPLPLYTGAITCIADIATGTWRTTTW